MKGSRYAQIVDQIQPFDLIGFRSYNWMGDTVIVAETITNSQLKQAEFSHVGTIVTRELLDLPQLIPGRLYIFESTTSTTLPGKKKVHPPDIIRKSGWVGVQLRDFENVLTSYTADGRSTVAWCKLKDNPWSDTSKREELRHSFREFFESYHGRLYEMSPITMAASAFPVFRGAREVRHRIISTLIPTPSTLGIEGKIIDPNQWQFCSELSTRCYQLIGRIPPHVIPENVVPQDFIEQSNPDIPIIVDLPIYLHI